LRKLGDIEEVQQAEEPSSQADERDQGVGMRLESWVNKGAVIIDRVEAYEVGRVSLDVEALLVVKGRAGYS
jgi:hypothetical protein